MEHAGGRRGKTAVSLPVGAGPGVWVRPSVLTGCSLTLGLAPSLCEFRRLHAIGGFVANASLNACIAFL